MWRTSVSTACCRWVRGLGLTVVKGVGVCVGSRCHRAVGACEASCRCGGKEAPRERPFGQKEKVRSAWCGGPQSLIDIGLHRETTEPSIKRKSEDSSQCAAAAAEAHCDVPERSVSKKPRSSPSLKGAGASAVDTAAVDRCTVQYLNQQARKQSQQSISSSE